MHRGSPSTFPVLYAQVVLDRGEVAAVAWDAGCFDCEEEDAACTANEFEYDGSMAKDAAEQCSVADDKCAKGEAQVAAPTEKETVTVVPPPAIQLLEEASLASD